VIRAVVDASVLVSALIAPRDTPPSQVLRAWARGRFELVVSPKLLTELAGVLARPKFERYVSATDVAEFLEVLRGDALTVADPPAADAVTRDPADDYLVALARRSHADVLVSSDRHLLEADLPDLPVLLPRDFLTHLARAEAQSDG
jgi:putative PIN family toxin of toxin-antitoxin system